MMSQKMSNIVTIKWSGAEYKTWIEEVTPELAERVLGTNDSNRRLRNKRIVRYMSDMRAGKWRLTGEPIRLDQDGALLNGQHRLEAVRRSGCSVAMLFMSGIDRETRLVQDTGLAKSDADWSTLSVAAIKVTKAITRVFANSLLQTMSADAQIEAYTAIGPEHIEWAISVASGKGITRKAPVRAALAVTHKINIERAKTFAQRLNELELPAGSPEQALVRALTANGMKHHDVETELCMRAVVAATRDSSRAVGLLRSLGDADRSWLCRAACLDKLKTLRKIEGS